MSRIRFASRLALIVVGAIVLVQMLLAAIYFFDGRNVVGRPRVDPVLTQIAALAELLDRVPAADRPLVLGAASGVGFVPRIVEQRPAEIRSPLLRRAESRLRALLGATDRYVALSLVGIGPEGERPVTRLRDLIGAQGRAVVVPSTGDYLDVDFRGGQTLRMFGVPIGLVAGILGFAVALIALIAVRRETKPLSDLAAAVERFGAAIELQPLAERGAPDVRAVIQAVNAMQSRIAELIRSRTLVLGALSHDLRTYVTRLRLRLELLPESEQRQKATVDLDGMQSVMDDALAFARATFGGEGGEIVDLAAVAREACDQRRGQGKPVAFADGDAKQPVRGSRAGLMRVVANLIDNALAYAGGAEVSLDADKEEAELRVEDRGPGIPAAERNKVFEPFYRLDPSRSRETGGAGLGLTIVRQIVETHRGTVTLEDRAGGGLRIRVRLPRAAKAEGAERRRTE
jgi:two-component system, OmpR family, osmolarity sensor histidine kinase EnvZ